MGVEALSPNASPQCAATRHLDSNAAARNLLRPASVLVTSGGSVDLAPPSERALFEQPSTSSFSTNAAAGCIDWRLGIETLDGTGIIARCPLPQAN
eukprot:7061564-Prymnesium_polylepis.1